MMKKSRQKGEETEVKETNKVIEIRMVVEIMEVK